MESTLRKTYVNDFYFDSVNSFSSITGKKIWVSIDETTDEEGYNKCFIRHTFDGPG